MKEVDQRTGADLNPARPSLQDEKASLFSNPSKPFSMNAKTSEVRFVFGKSTKIFSGMKMNNQNVLLVV